MTMDGEALGRIDTGFADVEPDPPRAVAHTATPVAPANPAWPRYIGVWAGLVAVILLILNRDVLHLVTRWWNSSTYGHCLLIPPILAWLVYLRKDGLKRLAPRPWPPGAALMLGAGLIWFVGELAGAALLRHAGIVTMLMATIPTIFGLAVTRGLAFPIGFALFMIPVGEQIEPYMQTITAHMSVWLLDLFGVPNHMDGVFISIPNGDFEVAEACSGVRFLIAMIAFGALVSNVCFLSAKRRFWFMVAAIVLPIVANGIRAWGTIYIAHLTTPEFARGVDHIVYGWIFFAFVMALLLGVGWRYFDRPVEDPIVHPERLQVPGTAAGPPNRLLLTAGLGLALAGAAPAYAALTEARTTERPTAGLAIAAPPGWSATRFEGVPWKPIYKGATAESYASFVDAAGQPVELFIAVYDDQHGDRELVAYGNGVIDELAEEGGWSWAADQRPPPGARASQINQGYAARDVVQYYWVNRRLTGSPYAAKIEGLKARLLGGDPQAATVIVSAQRRDPLVSARPAIERFVAAAGPADALVERSIVAQR